MFMTIFHILADGMCAHEMLSIKSRIYQQRISQLFEKAWSGGEREKKEPEVTLIVLHLLLQKKEAEILCFCGFYCETAQSVKTMKSLKSLDFSRNSLKK